MDKITTLDGVTHDVEVGDKVRITLKSGDSSDFTVTVAALGSLESEHNFFSGGCIQSLELIEKKPVSLPTGDGALIGHPTSSGYVSYIRGSGAKWYRVGSSSETVEQVTKEDVPKSMRIHGFEVLYEGRS